MDNTPTLEELLRIFEPEEQYNALRRQRIARPTKRAERKAKLTEAERYANGRMGSRFAQGGLPSLGKRQP
jgi:hypothetical protein